MNDHFVIRLLEGGDKQLASDFSIKTGAVFSEENGPELTVIFDKNGVSLSGFGLSYQGDFKQMLFRVTKGRLLHEILAKAAKTKEMGLKAVDATAGMGEDAFLLAAYGYNITLCEQNPVVALLLKDALRRGSEDPELKDIIDRMTLFEGDSLEYFKTCSEEVKLIYLDPMFPEKQKTGLINKKLQLIQKLEPPCMNEDALFNGAIMTGASRIIVKRPLKSQYLAGKFPNHTLKGKSIRYDCYIF